MCILSASGQNYFLQGQRRPTNHPTRKASSILYWGITTICWYITKFHSSTDPSPLKFKSLFLNEMFINEIRDVCQQPSHGQNQMAWFRINQGSTVMTLTFLSGDSANAVPHYQKLRSRVEHIWSNRKGQLTRSAMGKPHLRGTPFMIRVYLRAR